MNIEYIAGVPTNPLKINLITTPRLLNFNKYNNITLHKLTYYENDDTTPFSILASNHNAILGFASRRIGHVISGDASFNFMSITSCEVEDFVESYGSYGVQIKYRIFPWFKERGLLVSKPSVDQYVPSDAKSMYELSIIMGGEDKNAL